MNIVKLMGGLANQIRQYVYGRYLEYCTGSRTYYDDIFFFRCNSHNGYELKRVYNLDLPLISDSFKDLFSKSLVENKEIYQSLFESGSNIELILNDAGENICFSGRIIPFDKDSAFLPIPSNKNRYHWTYASEYEFYYQKIKNILDQELVFPPFFSETNRILAKIIENTSSVGIHVRHGDFARVGWLAFPDYYKKCIEFTEKELNPDKYYVFSDDIEFCKKNMKLYGFDYVKDRIEFVVGNNKESDYVDFHLMTLCKYIIVAPRSSFSSCACVLNKRLHKKINWETIGLDINDTFGWNRAN